MKHKIVTFAPGDLIFKENEHAEGLFLLSKGIIRQYCNKGKGKVELNLIRAGEITGELEFFSEGYRKRRFSAEAITNCELHYIGYDVFFKSFEQLNPLFKNLFSSLANRLEKERSRVKKLEDNNVSINYRELREGGTYNFFKEIEVVRFFAIFFTALKGQQVKGQREVKIARDTINYFAIDIFGQMEVKLEQFIDLLIELNLLEILEKVPDPNVEGEMKITYMAKDIEIFKMAFLFFNKERHLPEDKRIQINQQCLHLFEKIRQKHLQVSYKGQFPLVELEEILRELDASDIHVKSSDFSCAIKSQLMDEPYYDHRNHTVCHVDVPTVVGLLPVLRLKEAIERFNEEKRAK